MSTARFTADEARRRARVRRKILKATTEAEIARQAKEDGTDTAAVGFRHALKEGRLRTVTPLDVAAIRAKTGLSQDRFARAFQISPHTLRNWEQGRRVPEGPARALLLAIDRAPGAVLRALQG
ncbi:MAG: helix-turn-helix domain-containing protein [Rhodospirillales bacterium]|nr:helix-turn-helix domain-containing protein [Rhodospirillales bacterium]